MADHNRTVTDEVVDVLEKRLDDIAQRQAAIDKERREAENLLASLRRKGVVVRRPPTNPGSTTKAASISGLIIQAVADKPGAAAPDVVAAVHRLRPEVNTRVIHAILYRLRAIDKRIRHEGERGTMTYYVAEPQSHGARKEVRKKRSAPPYKALARKFVIATPGTHTVAEVASAINCTNMDQVRNILVRLNNAKEIHRVSEGVYAANPKEAVVPSG